MNSSVPKIKERLSIVDVVSSYLTIEKAGKNYKARCPFHNEKTPSFSISPDRGIYYCFGCGAKGDIFSFVEHFEGTDFLGALKILAEKAGVELSTYKSKEKDKTDIYYEIMEEATSYYENKFSENIEARSYLLSRGLNDLSIKNFRIGYAPESWTSALDHLIKKGFKKEDIETVGLIKKKDDRFYDRFRGRIMFPINDSSGRVIAFSGRIFGAEVPTKVGTPTIVGAKYLNSPDTPLFNKSNILFGLDKAKSSIRSRDYSIIVEGQMDLILSHQAGFTNTVAVSGTAFTDTTIDNELKINNLGLVRRLSSNIIFAYDGDDAGIRAANRSALIALSLDMQVKVAIFPKGKDPADIIQEDYKKWEKIIKNKTDIISFHLDKICEKYQGKESRRKQIEEKVFPFITKISSSIKKSNYIKEIYEKTGISESAITEDYKNFEKKQNINNETKEDKQLDIKDINTRRSHLEKKLFSIFFWKGENEEQSTQIEVFKANFEESIGSDDYNKMLKIHESNKDNLCFEAEMWYCDKINALLKDTEEIILNLEEEILNEQVYSLSIKIKDKEINKNKENLEHDITTYQKLVEKIESIKSLRSK
ncbi:MAG: DNA primase [Candidatus Pacebacteria bacterium]|nr:DNA primase [Candidatus Paceibacterota bacterium]